MVHHLVKIDSSKKQHNIIHIKASKKQLARLRKGHKVRIQGAMQGSGVNLIVSPEKYNIISKTFGKGKGAEIQLSSEEIMMNKEMSGEGIFGKKFDNFVERKLGKKGKDALYNVGDIAKEHLKKGIDRIADHSGEFGANALEKIALATGHPEFAPNARKAGHYLGSLAGSKASNLAKDYLDHPAKYQSNAVGNMNKITPHTLQGQVAQNELFHQLNEHLGTNYGNLASANLGNALAHKARAEMNTAQIEGAKGNGLYAGGTGLYAGGAGLYAGGAGLYAGGTGLHSRHREVGSVGRMGSFVSAKTQLPPALLSQPFSANFQFQHTLPPAFQKYNRGGGLYV
jgi:hypothetical protein